MLLFEERVALMQPAEAAGHLRGAVSLLQAVTDPQWTTGFYAKDAQGELVGVRDQAACSWCLEGLVYLYGGPPAAEAVRIAYAKSREGRGDSLATVNDGAGSRESLIKILECAVGRLDQ